ncbi:DUF1015 family protein [Thermoplasmatales archaeon AK]|nr:DUF1015 family protein [Thermoplasmatales archaeon AK]
MKIEPFRPLFYSDGVEKFVAPPFDTLSERQIRELKSRDHNILQLFYEDGSTPKSRLEEWIREKVLVEDDEQSFVILTQRFLHNGVQHERIGVIGAVDLNEKQFGLRPHEMTFPESVKQRRGIFIKLETQMEPLLVLSPEVSLERVLSQSVTGLTPRMRFQEPLGVLNSVFTVSDPNRIGLIQSVLGKQIGMIADGHHRLKAIESINGDYHRNFRAPRIQTDQAIAGISEYFDLIPEKRASPRMRMILYDGSLNSLVMNHRGEEMLKKLNIKPQAVTCVSDLLILRNILNIDTDPARKEVEFTAHDHVAIDAVDSGQASLALLMPPWEKDHFINIVNEGILLPQKSTYFYPKIPAGLVLYRMKHETA